MGIHKRALVVGMAAAVATTWPMLIREEALASAPVDSCQAKSEASVVAVYSRNTLSIPLRCGTLNYGFTHLVARGRWSDVFESDVVLTIARGKQSDDGTVYAWFDDNCTETFRVIVNPGPIGSSGFRPQGVITAYEVSSPTTVAYRTDVGGLRSISAATARTDCPIISPVSGKPGYSES